MTALPEIKIQSVAVFCSNLERSVSWYEKMLGFKKVWQALAETGQEAGESTHAVALLKGADMYLELHECPGCAPQTKDSYWRTWGVKHFSLWMEEEELPVLVEYLKSHGVVFTVEHRWHAPYNYKPGGFVVCFFNDPDGNTIEIESRFTPGEGLYPGEEIFDM